MEGGEADEGRFELASNEDFAAAGDHDEHTQSGAASTSGASELSSSSSGATWRDKLPAGVIEPIISHPTVQRGSEAARKLYNREDGYEPAKLVPYFAGSIVIVILCIFLAGRCQFRSILG